MDCHLISGIEMEDGQPIGLAAIVLNHQAVQFQNDIERKVGVDWDGM
jgi:hypothetical protein